MDKWLIKNSNAKLPCIHQNQESEESEEEKEDKSEVQNSIYEDELIEDETLSRDDQASEQASIHDISSKNKDLNLRKRSAGCSNWKDDNENEDTLVRKQPKISPSQKAETNASKKKARKQYKQLFCNVWRNEFGGWLKKFESKSKSGDDLAYCIACEKCLTAHKSAILRHSKSEKHIQNAAKSSTNKKIDDTPSLRLDKSIRRAELKLTGLLAVNHLPFLLKDVLSPLCADIFPDSEIAKQLAVRRTKATALMTKSLGKNFREELFNKLRELGAFFSIIIDEQTDQSSSKQCAFTVTFYDFSKYEVKTRLFDMIEMSCGTADNLYGCLKRVLEEKNIPLQNLVGYSSDTTNVMFGSNHLVDALLKKLLPDVVFIKCSCHSASLAICQACLKLPRSDEDLVRNFGAHFSRSALRRDSLKEFQEFFKTEIHAILTVCTTRWLSLKQCVDRILEQYPALEGYFTELAFRDPSKTNDEIVSTISNKFTLIYLEFMSYALGLMTDFNLQPEVEKWLKTICSNYLEVEYVKNVSNIFDLDHQNSLMFVEDNNIYLGVLATESIYNLRTSGNLNPRDLDVSYKGISQFFKMLVSELKERYQFTDPVSKVIKIVDPPFAQSLKVKSLQCVLSRFPVLKQFVDQQKLDQEWHQHGLNHEEYQLDSSLSPEVYWRKAFQLKNATGVPLFINLEKVMGLLLVLPFSNVAVERFFSQVKLTKTLHRNHLSNETLNSVLATREGVADVGGLLQFNPTKEMMDVKIWE